MSAHKIVMLACDGGTLVPGGSWPKDFTRCIDQFSDHSTIQEPAAVRRSAKAAGWRHRDGLDYCEDHAHLVNNLGKVKR